MTRLLITDYRLNTVSQICVLLNPILKKKMSTSKKKIIAIKVGSNVITNKEGFPDEQIIVNISETDQSFKGTG